MNNFKTIYRILKALEDSMDYEEFDAKCLAPELLGVSEARRDYLLAALLDAGYIDVVHKISVGTQATVELLNVRITLAGLEYFASNETIAKVKEALKMGVRIVI